MHFLGVNLLAVFVAAISTMVIGFLWYSPMLFAKPWMIAMGMDPNDKAKIEAMQKDAGKLYGTAFVGFLITAFVLGKLFVRLEVADLPRAMMFSFAIWLAFVSMVQLTNTLFGSKPVKLWMIDTGYQLACYLGMGAILAMWR
jgi:hypothetical protein